MRAYAQFAGAPASVFAYYGGSAPGAEDLVARPRFAAWDHPGGEDAVYLLLSLNAYEGSARGVSSFVYSSFNGGPFEGVAGSLELQTAIHDELVADLRAELDPIWTDRGKLTNVLGDLNPLHNAEMPGVYVAPGFATDASDAALLSDVGGAYVVARAVAQGVAAYFATRDGLTLTLPPEAPVDVSAVQTSADSIELRWAVPPGGGGGAGDPPTGYRVYTSPDGLAFDAGTDVAGTTFALSGLPTGAARYFRVAARNTGGLSRPSPVVGASICGPGRVRVLVVNGYTRESSVLQTDVPGLPSLERLWRRGSNDERYVARHGRAIDLVPGYCFAAATDAAVTTGAVSLPSHAVVDWFTGNESFGDVPFDTTARALLSDYVTAGGRLLVSGSEIAWSHGQNGTAEEQAFLADTLRLAYALDDAGTYDVSIDPVGPLAANAPFAFSFLDAPTLGYDVRFPDAFTPMSGSATAFGYEGGGGLTAGIAWADAGSTGDRGVVLGFPFETISSESNRIALMSAVLEFLAPTPVVIPALSPAGLVLLALGIALACFAGIGRPKV
jgi:hypothetical protein